MESILVIKVKYGEILRRFNARVNENNQLDLDMNGLREKIFSLFGFTPDADVELTYIDEDGDVVTLVNDDDLHDVMRQNLKFLRINVQLSSGRSGISYARSSGNSTPLRSPRIQNPLPNLSTAVSEIWKSVPEPLCGPLTRLCLDVASKSALSSSVIAELADCFNKLGQSYLNPDSLSPVDVESNTQNVVSEIPVIPSGANSKSMGDGFPEVPSKSTIDLCSKNRQEITIGKETKGVGADTSVTSFPGTVDLNVLPPDSITSGCAVVNQELFASNGVVDVTSAPIKHVLATSQMNNNFLNECPFSGVPVTSASSVPRSSRGFIRPVKRSYSHTEATGGIFHKGVICDGCGVHPITGPRFKSSVKENFDLCSICFAKMGNETDYIRFDRPVSFRHPHSFKGLHNRCPWVGPPVLPHIVRGFGVKSGQSKLDSRFILDVNVLDGTIMAPGTPFTKIWRMRNNGTSAWPQGTHLEWIGGVRFSDAASVEIEIPADGLPVDKELDVAVDFRAPELPGQYISYWRMVSSSGQKFGQRVWVLIQVDAYYGGSLSESSPALNLNLPPESSGSKKDTEILNMNVEPAANLDFLQSCKDEVTTTQTLEPEKHRNDDDLYFPTDDTLLVGQTVTASSPQASSSAVSYPVIDNYGVLNSTSQAPSVSYPRIDLSEPTIPAASLALPPASSEEATFNEAVEDSLLKELEMMGFKQVDLNKEVLRFNKYNLEQSVDDLCGVCEWDPILEELQEMGFCDEEMNKKLLVKNNGSLKRVVMDLLSSGEKA